MPMFGVLLLYVDNHGYVDAKEKPRGFSVIDENHPGGAFRDHEVQEADAWAFNAWLATECGIDTGLSPNRKEVFGEDKISVLAYVLTAEQAMSFKIRWL